MENKEYEKGCECGMCEGQCGASMECGGYTCGMGCQHMYGMRCGGRHYLLRWVLGIVILVLVFVAGIKLGEFRGLMGGNDGYGYRMMNGRGYNAMPGYGMMQWRDDIDTNAYYRYGMMRTSEAPKQSTTAQ